MTFKFKTPCFSHQLECWEIMKNESSYGLFAEPGLGKTKIALDTVSYHVACDPTYRALVVCPNTLVENWADEIEKHSDLSYVLLTGSKGKRIKLMQEKANIYVINYESTRVLNKELRDMKFNHLILDESTAVKNFKSLQSKACYDISTTIPNKIIMSGTPILNSPLDIFAQYKILNAMIFGISYYRFRGRYAVMGGYMNKQVIQWRNMEDLKRRIFSCAIRKTKDECLDLPDKLYQVVHVDLTDEQREMYDKLKQDFIYEFKDVVVTAPIMLTRLMRFSQITAGFTKDVEGVEHVFKRNPKIDWLVNFITELPPEAKVVLFCRFRREIAIIEDALRQHGIQHVSVHGDVTDRIERVKKFNTDKDTRVFIGQLQTAGIGINLTSASYCVFMSNSYSYGERIQAEDRTHRIGQTRNVTYIDILARSTIDVGIHRALRKKESLASMVTGDIIKML